MSTNSHLEILKKIQNYNHDFFKRKCFILKCLDLQKIFTWVVCFPMTVLKFWYTLDTNVLSGKFLQMFITSL